MAIKPQRTVQAFPSPILVFENPAHAELRPRLVEACQALRRRDPGVQRSNLGGSWHSPDDLFKLKDPAVQQARGFIQSCIEGAMNGLEAEKAASMDVSLYGWININPQHAINKPHNHPDSLFSGCYYVQVPASSDPMSGLIEFLDPRTGANMVSSPYLAFKPSLAMRPQAGQLFIFPSYLSHWVTPNAEPEDRISIAFNARVNMRRAESAATPAH